MPLSDIAVWTKANPELEPDGELRGFYRSAHELCLVFKAGERPHLKDVKPRRTNVWNYPAPVGVDGGVHPTAKPVALISEILLDCTKPGDLVLDTMIGAGSTLIAAEETGRTCIGVELDPYYVEVAIRRWQDHTGKHAVHLQTGQLFDDLAQHLLTHQGGQHGGHDDEVGYKKPPKTGQFKPGQSGNPRGRKKNVANFKTDLTTELNELIVVRENGRERRISKQKAFIKAMIALAIKGDIRAINAIVACTRNFGAGTDQAADDDVGSDDLDIFQDHIDQERRRRERSASSSSSRK
jgi:hypothetical protein